MNIIDFLTTMENSLNQIRVEGEDNLELLIACIRACKQAKRDLMTVPNDAQTTPIEGGEGDGRQSDKRPQCGDRDNDK